VNLLQLMYGFSFIIINNKITYDIHYRFDDRKITIA